MQNSQTHIILENAKRAMKAGGFTYRDLAKHLKLSEPTIKRMFSKRLLTLSRLDEICEFLGVSIHDLSATNLETKNAPYLLTLEQESFFSKNIVHWKFFVFFLSNRSIEKSAKLLGLNKIQVVRCLRGLESLGLIQWNAGDKAKLLVSPHIKLRPRGELRTKLAHRIGG